LTNNKKTIKNSLLTEMIDFLEMPVFGLKIPRGQPRLGSIPSSGTKEIKGLANNPVNPPFISDLPY